MTRQLGVTERATYSVKETAAIAGVSRDKVYQAIKDGQLEARKWGRRTIIPADALRRFLTDLPALRLSSSE